MGMLVAGKEVVKRGVSGLGTASKCLLKTTLQG